MNDPSASPVAKPLGGAHAATLWPSSGAMGKIAPPEMISEIERAWAETFRYAAERSPFYRELLKEFRSVPRLEQVLPINKHVLSERNLDFLCVPRCKVQLFYFNGIVCACNSAGV